MYCEQSGEDLLKAMPRDTKKAQYKSILRKQRTTIKHMRAQVTVISYCTDMYIFARIYECIQRMLCATSRQI